MLRIRQFVKANSLFVIFLLTYFLVRLILININYTEWGDTFRMVRAAEYISQLNWPWDEKRWPFYAILLVPGIWLNSPVVWGRVVSIFASIGTLSLIYLFYLRFINANKKYAVLSMVLVALSSVFAYWSIRMMADTVFVFLILLYSYLFMKNYSESKSPSGLKVLVLSMLLLAITMTRLEGAFIAASSVLYLLLKRRWRDVSILIIPQLLIYVPWTVYAKFLYKGPVQYDYFDEAKGFVFNFQRFVYYFTYTVFILVFPILAFFVGYGSYLLSKEIPKKEWLEYLPVVGFITLVLIIGFIWTPSLPRIYMPVIPFFVMAAAYGLQKFELKKGFLKKNWYLFFLINGILLGLFLYLQYTQRLYFLGASKGLFIIIIAVNAAIVGLSYFPKYGKSILIAGLIALNILTSAVVIQNQRFVYRTVKDAIDYVLEKDVKVAYADETGNSEWYLRNSSYYLNPSEELDLDEMFIRFYEEDVDYMIYTTEFNRGSFFELPTDGDVRFYLEKEFKQPIQDPFDILLDRLGIIEDSDYTVYETKVYQVDCGCLENSQ